MEAVAAWAGLNLGSAQRDRLARYVEWLRTEAIGAGLIGLGEAPRLWERHVADSLSFAVGWNREPSRLVDIGSGAGLPGVPLAVAWSRCRTTLVDRSQRAHDLLQRVVRLLSLPNVVVQKAEAADLEAGWEAVVMRATLRPELAGRLAYRLLAPGGRAVVGLGSGAIPSLIEDHLDLTVEVVEVEVLDGSPRLLIMTRSG